MIFRREMLQDATPRNAGISERMGTPHVGSPDRSRVDAWEDGLGFPPPVNGRRFETAIVQQG